MTCVSDPPQPTLPALIALAFDQHVGALLRHVHESGHGDITLSHFLNVLRFVSREGVRPARIAEQAGISQQGISLLIADLVERGYLERTPDPIDRRAQIVRWSAKGEVVARDVEQWFGECERAWRAAAGESAVEGAITTMDLVARGGLPA